MNLRGFVLGDGVFHLNGSDVQTFTPTTTGGGGFVSRRRCGIGWHGQSARRYQQFTLVTISHLFIVAIISIIVGRNRFRLVVVVPSRNAPTRRFRRQDDGVYPDLGHVIAVDVNISCCSCGTIRISAGTRSVDPTAGRTERRNDRHRGRRR